MLTGKIRFKVTLFGNIKMYVQDKITSSDPFDTRYYFVWRKASSEEKWDFITSLDKLNVTK